MNDQLRPVVKEGYQAENFDGEILLYSMASTTAVYLNDTAHLVWRLCGEDVTVGQMIAMLEEQYPEQAEHIRPDVIAALEMLVANQVIDFANDL